MATTRKGAVKSPARVAQCNLNYGYTLIALVLFTLALYGLVNGFALHLQDVQLVAAGQAARAGFAMIALWYFAGFLLMLAGKRSKWKSHWNCPVHGKMM